MVPVRPGPGEILESNLWPHQAELSPTDADVPPAGRGLGGTKVLSFQAHRHEPQGFILICEPAGVARTLSSLSYF